MANSEEWELPEALRPQQARFEFDLAAKYRSVVLVHTEASEDGYTAPFLGTERLGSGVVIRSAERKLVLTIGYLITEAESIWLTSLDGKVVEAAPMAYDQASGFGPVQPLPACSMPRPSNAARSQRWRSAIASWWSGKAVRAIHWKHA